MKKFHAISISLGIILLLVIIHKTDLAGLLHELIGLSWWVIPLFLIQLAAETFHAFAWRYCLVPPYSKISFFYLWKIHMSGFAINYLTPTVHVGGEITRATLLAGIKKDVGSASAVIVGKLADALALLLFVSVGSIAVFLNLSLPTGVWPALLSGSILLGTGLIAFLFIQKFGYLGAVVRWLVRHNIGGNLLRSGATMVSDLDRDLQNFYQKRPYSLPLSIFWHTIGYSCVLGQVIMFLYATNPAISLRVGAGVGFLQEWFDLVTFAVPLGLGVQEGSRMLAFKSVGLGMLSGLVFALVQRMSLIFCAVIGLAEYSALLPATGRKPSYSLVKVFKDCGKL